MNSSRCCSSARTGPHANLPRRTTTRTKITRVHSALPTLPANGLRLTSCSWAATVNENTVSVRTMALSDRSFIRVPSDNGGAGSRFLVPGSRFWFKFQVLVQGSVRRVRGTEPEPGTRTRTLNPGTWNSGTLQLLRDNRQQADDDGEERGAFDHGCRDDHRSRDLAGRCRLPRHRLDRRTADPADAGGAADNREPGTDRAAEPCRALAGEKRRFAGGLRGPLRKRHCRHRHHGDARARHSEGESVELLPIHRLLPLAGLEACLA